MSKKILVIDDSASIRKSISYVLSQEKFTVVEAEDGVDGLGKANAELNAPFDLIVTDINMPNLDGIGFIKQVRTLAAYKFTPIIVLTTESQESKMQEGKAAGATGWIVKPFSADKLIAVVKKIIG
jgi:two-component system chemotaxis response regulator CheY